MPSLQEIGALLEQARAIAVKYYELTGKPLGITGEIGEYEAARLLALELKYFQAMGCHASRAVRRPDAAVRNQRSQSRKHLDRREAKGCGSED